MMVSPDLRHPAGDPLAKVQLRTGKVSGQVVANHQLQNALIGFDQVQPAHIYAPAGWRRFR